MKNTIFIVALVLSPILSAVPATAATKVFLLAGQSNMAGCGITTDLATTPYNTPQTAVRFWKDNTTGWVDLNGGYGFPGYGISMFGPEVSFGYTLHNLFPNDDIYLVKHGANSTNLAVNWNTNSPDWNSFKEFKGKVQSAMIDLNAQHLSPQIAGMIWMQGESDAMNPTYAAAYQANLANFIQQVRLTFGPPDMPFIVGRINTDPHWGTEHDIGLVRSAQMLVPGQVDHASWIDTDDLSLWSGNEPGHSDPGHYDSQGQIDLGIRFANKFATAPEPSTLVLTGTGVLAIAVYWWRKRNAACS